MTILLDTHVWLWMLIAPERLGKLHDVVEDASTTLLLSAASSWEIAIKHSIGRLALPEPPERYVPSRIRSSRVTPVGVDHAHALAVAELPLLHRDPFDRILIVQARAYGVPLATADEALRAYDVDIIMPTS